MYRIVHGTKIDFIRWWRWAVAITAAFIVIGFSMLGKHGGVNYSIEFTGGTLMQLQFQNPPDVAQIRATLDGAGIHGAEIQQFGSTREFTVRAQDPATVAGQAAGAERVSRRIEAVLLSRFGAQNVRIVRTEAVGPRVGAELRRGAVIAILISFAIILIYLAVRFEWRFGLAAILATGHDILATLAFITLLDLEVSLTVVAALLTVIGYSMNDTIIIFDRVRENLRRSRNESLYDTLNRSINETLPRSILTHATTLAATVTLLIFAGEVIRPFAWVMSFGIFTGTFSSVYVAAPVLMWIERKWPRPTTTTRTRGTEPAVRPRATTPRPAPAR